MLNVLSPVRPSAAHEIVAENLRRAIYLGRYLPGNKFPPERELSVGLEVSRTTLRAALKLLVNEGLVEIKRGVKGGITVLSVNLSPEELDAAITAREQELEQLYEYRLMMEGTAARLAAQRRTGDQLATISDALEAMEACLPAGVSGDQDAMHRFFAADTQFHCAIAAASGNRHLLPEVENIWVARFMPIGGVFQKMESYANDGHRDIFEAIRAQDGRAAEAAMTTHIEGTLNGIRDMFARAKR